MFIIGEAYMALLKLIRLGDLLKNEIYNKQIDLRSICNNIVGHVIISPFKIINIIRTNK